MRYFGTAFLGLSAVEGIDVPAVVQAAPQAPGGIDIRDIGVGADGDGEGVVFNEQVLRQMMEGGFDGLTPVLITVTPVRDPLSLMGVK